MSAPGKTTSSQKRDLRKAMKEYGDKISRENRNNLRRSVTPPGQHRIAVYGGAVPNKDAHVVPKSTPLHCEFVQPENTTKLPAGHGFACVSNQEYRLLKKFLPPFQKKSYKLFQKQNDDVQVQTLFGWVSASPQSTFESSATLESSTTTTRIVDAPDDSEAVTLYAGLPKECESENESSAPELPLPSRRVSYHDICTATESDFLLHQLHLPKMPSRDSEAQTRTFSRAEWKLMQGYDSPTNLGDNSIEKLAVAMKQSILTASEASVVLMNKMFKSALTDSSAIEAVEKNQQFQEFVNSKHELEALDKAGQIFSEAHDSIQKYLDQFGRESDALPDTVTTAKERLADYRVRPARIANTVVYRHISSIQPVPPELLPTTGDPIKLNKEVKAKKSVPGPQNFQMSITAKPGIISETIHCNNCEYSMVYSGGVDRINLLESAIREKSEAIHLHPQRLLEMIDRNATFASGRITSSKYYISFVSSQVSSIVRNFLSGNFSRRINAANNKNTWDSKVVTKLQSLNVFSGIILQAATSLFSVVRNINAAIEQAMQLDDVLRIPRVPGLAASDSLHQRHSGPVNITQEDGLPLGTKMPMSEVITQLSAGVKETDTILLTLKNSLESLSHGVKVKKAYRKRIEYFFMAVKQLEFGHDVDFGTVIMALTCNAALVQSLLGSIVPTVDVEMRSRILGNLGHLNWGSGELVKVVKKVCLLSSFISSKSLDRLRQMIVMRRRRKLNKHKWFRAPAKPSFKKRSVKSNLQVVDEEREETE